jgi:CheY-like chemotaxis protein
MGTRRVMVVDDEQSFTEMIRLSLEQLGDYTVREVNDATQAVSTAREFEPELILLDVMMPDMDGGDVAAAFGQDPQFAAIPIIYMTSLVSQEEAPLGGLISSKHRFLPKPTSIVELLETIEGQFGGDGALPPSGAA